MPLLPDDERLLYRALALAEDQAAFASPNPTVGCVLTLRGAVLGEGAHRYDLRDHAEIAALKDSARHGQSTAGATAYVTLEPCSHHGRTGPCADALIAAGIARCVVATVDPNPQVSGSGLGKLQRAGVEVVVAEPASAPAQAARRLNDAFAFSIQHGRPFVTLKAALSADGKLAPDPASRATAAPHWITGPVARADVQQLRHRSDALLTGIGTVLADDPVLTDRTGLPRRRPLLRVVLDSQLRIPLGSKLVREARNDLLVVTSASAPAARERALAGLGIEVIRSPAQRLQPDLAGLLEVLQKRDMRSILVEAGSTLNASFLQAERVDQVTLYIGPRPLGADAVPFAAGMVEPKSLTTRLTGTTQIHFPHGTSQDLRLTGYLRDPWAGVGRL